MFYKYLCGNCKFTWDPLKESDSVKVCPICASEDIIRISQKNHKQLKNRLSDENKYKESITQQYVVPWMIEI